MDDTTQQLTLRSSSSILLLLCSCRSLMKRFCSAMVASARLRSSLS